MYEIKDVSARVIFNSRGDPTIECALKTSFGKFTASVPYGASVGSKEAKYLYDGEKEFGGNGVKKAVANINEILSVVVKGMDCREQSKIDEALIAEDGTKNKEKLGANAILAVSMAACRAGATACKSELESKDDCNRKDLFEHISELSNKKPLLPVPALNIINGGKHAGNELAFQEYQIIPHGFDTFKESFYAGVEIFHELGKEVLEDYGKGAINVGYEGGFAPAMSKIEEPLDEILKAIETLGYAGKVGIGIDVAASSFSKKDDVGKFIYDVEGHKLNAEKLSDEYVALLENYPIISIEDPFHEDDFEAWEQIYSKLGKRVQILADDLTVSNKKYVKEAIDNNRANALLLKINQVGTIAEAIESAKVAYDAKWKVQVSHRSGETNDYFIADFAVGLGCGQIKSGAPNRGERIAKYNRLLKIEEENGIAFAGKRAFPLLK
ncbi:MAG: phosphopyruvate hydratase [Candidatus Diapherotrites archaeon]|jgi:enolase|uniref:Enolase n=1 Tax=Candidatus Iainarchaeum sp. TaxID=3101447 RepID=A0A8T5GFV8_9ARCH|nr:phosphopyruvate hydratase [Candidatus Diapherotrites archaeon]MBT7241281.1 phosphopyruvate hydratase [Candidatus Diapherotrites archaeon]